jgi:hypothetical protein
MLVSAAKGVFGSLRQLRIAISPHTCCPYTSSVQIFAYVW